MQVSIYILTCIYFEEFGFYLFFTDISPEIKEKLLDYVERYAMTLLYRILFCPPFTTDEEKDLAIQKRFISLDSLNYLYLIENISSDFFLTEYDN